MQKKYALAIIAAAAAGLLAVIGWTLYSTCNPKSMSVTTPPTRTLYLNGHRIEAEVVSSEEGIRQGLSDRVSLPSGQGMLFELGVRSIHPFWMNRMHFPIDIIWIDGNRVVEIASDVPPPGPLEMPTIRVPKAEAERVLEVNAGVVAETGLKEGDAIDGLGEPR